MWGLIYINLPLGRGRYSAQVPTLGHSNIDFGNACQAANPASAGRFFVLIGLMSRLRGFRGRVGACRTQVRQAPNARPPPGKSESVTKKSLETSFLRADRGET